VEKNLNNLETEMVFKIYQNLAKGIKEQLEMHPHLLNFDEPQLSATDSPSKYANKKRQEVKRSHVAPIVEKLIKFVESRASADDSPDTFTDRVKSSDRQSMIRHRFTEKITGEMHSYPQLTLYIPSTSTRPKSDKQMFPLAK